VTEASGLTILKSNRLSKVFFAASTSSSLAPLMISSILSEMAFLMISFSSEDISVDYVSTVGLFGFLQLLITNKVKRINAFKRFIVFIA